MRRIFHWPLFSVLAAFHLAILPLLLNERTDIVVSTLAGLAYTTLAAADWRLRNPSRSAG